MWDPREPPTVEQVAERLPRFEIKKVLGQGALGAVYGAVDKRPGRIMAIKVMFENPDAPEYSERFDREASVMAMLDHPNIVTIHEYDKVGDLHYLVMERMEAGSLGDEIARTKTLSPQRAIEVVGQVCDALSYVHSCGFRIHPR